MGYERVPHRTCAGQRRSGLVPEAERQIALLGQQILKEVQPEKERSEACIKDHLDCARRRITSGWRNLKFSEIDYGLV